MLKKRKSLISLFMAVIMLVTFCVPAMAMEPATVPFENGIKVVENEAIAQRALGIVGIEAIRIYPANLSKGEYYTDSYSYTYGNINQICNITINSATKNLYTATGCNGWYVQVDARTSGAVRYEGEVNGSLVGSGSVTGNFATFSFGIPDFGTSSNWMITLYDYSRGIPLWGHIYK